MKNIKLIIQELDENSKLIYSFYERAYKALKEQGYDEVRRILHIEMNSVLYDESLNILENTHIDKSQEELKHLIEKVDFELENYFSTDKQEEELINDESYVKSIFNKRKYKK